MLNSLRTKKPLRDFDRFIAYPVLPDFPTQFTDAAAGKVETTSTESTVPTNPNEQAQEKQRVWTIHGLDAWSPERLLEKRYHELVAMLPQNKAGLREIDWVSALVCEITGTAPTEFRELFVDKRLPLLERTVEWYATKGHLTPDTPDHTENPEPSKTSDGESPPPEAENEPKFIFRPDGNGYYVEGFGESGHYKQLKGLTDLFRLVQSPGEEVLMLELDAGPGATRAAGDAFSRQPIIDFDELRNLNTNLRRYKAEVDEAENDAERASSQEKLEECIEAIRAMTGHNGKARELNNPNDKLRAKIAGRIATACNAMADANNPCPKLAQHFVDTCAAEGASYKYSPGTAGMKWDTTKKTVRSNLTQ